MIISEHVEIKITKHNIDWYKAKDYDVELKDKITVHWLNDLPPYSKKELDFQCDYCNCLFKRPKTTWFRSNEKTSVKKDACSSCRMKKLEDCNMVKYGVTSVMHVPEFKNRMHSAMEKKYGTPYYSQTSEHKNKVKNTNLQRYGVEHYFQSQECKDKTIKTMNERYGVDWYTQTDEYKQRAEKTNLDKYGFKNPMQNEQIRLKGETTNLLRYGVRNVFESEEIKERIKDYYRKNYGVDYSSETAKFKNFMIKQWNIWRDSGEIHSIREKARLTSIKKYGVPYPMQNPTISNKTFTTMYKNGTAPSSRQQKHIHHLVSGELNFPVGRSVLDIAFVDDKIYLEYDGGGHNLQVKFGTMTQEAFNKKERNRSYYLSREGWKEIRIITEDDKLPSDDLIKDFVNITKSFFNADKGFSVRWNLNFNEVLVNYKHTYSITEFIENNKVSEEI